MYHRSVESAPSRDHQPQRASDYQSDVHTPHSSRPNSGTVPVHVTYTTPKLERLVRPAIAQCWRHSRPKKMPMPVRGALNQVTGRELWPPECIDEMDDSERKDDARTKSHENFCGQDALSLFRGSSASRHFSLSVARGPFSSMPPPGPWHRPGSRPARSCRSRTSAREPACRRGPDTIQGRGRRSERPSDSAPVAAREPRPPLPLRPRPADPSVARPRWAGEESTSGSSWGDRLPDRVTRRHTEARRASETPRQDATAPAGAGDPSARSR